MHATLILLLWILVFGVGLMAVAFVVSLMIARRLLKDHWVKTQFK